MPIRPLWLVLVVLLVPAAARANDHVAGAGGGPGFCSDCGSKLGGIHAMFEVSWPVGRLHDYFGIAADFSVHGDDKITRATFLIGGRGSYWKSGTRHVPSAHVLVGQVRTHTAAGRDRNFAIAAGGGYEFLVGDTTSSDGWSLRGQVDYVHEFGIDDGFGRFALGVVYRFKHK